MRPYCRHVEVYPMALTPGCYGVALWPETKAHRERKVETVQGPYTSFAGASVAADELARGQGCRVYYEEA